MNYKIRDKRDKGWFYLDNEYLNGYARIFGAVGTAIYVSLCRHANVVTQECFPSMQLIADELNIERHTVSRYIKMFADAGLLAIEKERNKETKKWENNTYFLLDKSQWKSHGEITTTGSHGSLNAKPMVAKLPIRRLTIKETNTSSGKPQVTHNNLGSQVIKAFEEVDGKNKTYYGNTTQRGACDYLLQEFGLEVVLERIKLLPRTNKLPYFPKIHSPYDLKEKWVKLEDAVSSKRQEVKSKENYIL